MIRSSSLYKFITVILPEGTHHYATLLKLKYQELSNLNAIAIITWKERHICL
jgi:hypothetical protein